MLIFSSGSSGVGYGSYERARRSPNEVDQNDMDPLIWLDTIQSRLDQAGLSSPHCHHLAVCTAHMDNDDDNNNLGRFVTTAMERLEALKAMDARLDGFRTAARVGRDGKNCKKMYNKCGVGYHEVTRVLDMA